MTAISSARASIDTGSAAMTMLKFSLKGIRRPLGPGYANCSRT